MAAAGPAPQTDACVGSATVGGALTGRRIAIPETRQLSVLADLLTRRGAEVLRCPLVGIHDAPDPAPVLAWLHEFNAGACDDLILLTGEGLRRLQTLAERSDANLAAAFRAALGQARKITRGPKPNKALRELGLTTDIAAPEPTTGGVIKALAQLELAGRTVGVQLYGTEPNRPLIEAIERAGARARPVAPYVYADEAETAAVEGLVDDLIAGRIDAITFTSSPQISRLLRIAKAQDRDADLHAALENTCVAAVGPVVADQLRARGLPVHVMPTSSYFMKPLVTELSRHFKACADKAAT